MVNFAYFLPADIELNIYTINPVHSSHMYTSVLNSDWFIVKLPLLSLASVITCFGFMMYFEQPNFDILKFGLEQQTSLPDFRGSTHINSTLYSRSFAVMLLFQAEF